MLRTLVLTRLILSLALDHSLAVHGTESHISRCSSDCAANTLCEALALSDMPESKEVSDEYELDDLFSCKRVVIDQDLKCTLKYLFVMYRVANLVAYNLLLTSNWGVAFYEGAQV